MRPHALASKAWIARAFIVLCWPFAGTFAWGDEPVLEFHAPVSATDASVATVMRDLAERMLPVYQEPDRDRYLANLSAMQVAADDFAAADVSRQELAERRRSAEPVPALGRATIYDTYVHARALEAHDKISFAESFTKGFDETLSRLSDREAYLLIQWLETPPASFRNSFQKALDQQRAKDSITQAEAMQIFWRYLSYQAYQTFSPLAASLGAADDKRRYTVDDQVVIKARDGAEIHGISVRPKSATGPLSTLFEFTIHDGAGYAKECAAHGYVGVVAYVRGKHDRKTVIVPFQHVGEDASAVIDWIVTQPWSDKRVGMYGEGYSAFGAWAAAARAPPGLVALASGASTAPGIDTPMIGNIFQNSAYRWSLQVANQNPALDAIYGDDAVWRTLNEKWYRSGRRYRDMGRLYGQGDPLFVRWLNHPSYDRFWQKMIPFQKAFARIKFPVLTTTGYFAQSAPGDLYYFTEHLKYAAHADHTLIIGPYDDAAMHRAPQENLHGYQLDPAAIIDLHELRYQWFDHVLKGAAAPALIKDRINYQVMGSNDWKHAASLEAMAGGSLRLFLDPAASSAGHRLLRHKSAKLGFVPQLVSFVDRSDAAWMPPTDLISRRLVAHNGTIFVSEPLTKATEFSGFLAGRLDFTVNKMDVDLNIMLYEELANGDFIRLFNPAYEFRASYARDRVHRHLLKAGVRQQLAFRSDHMTSRELQAGSRLVMVLSVDKRPDREINYGTGNDVSDESIADGKVPLKIRWYSNSYIDIPVKR
jgi:predicted acyl esterase